MRRDCKRRSWLCTGSKLCHKLFSYFSLDFFSKLLFYFPLNIKSNLLIFLLTWILIVQYMSKYPKNCFSLFDINNKNEGK